MHDPILCLLCRFWSLGVFWAPSKTCFFRQRPLARAMLRILALVSVVVGLAAAQAGGMGSGLSRLAPANLGVPNFANRKIRLAEISATPLFSETMSHFCSRKRDSDWLL